MEWKIKLKVNNREYITVYSYKGSERKSAIEDAIKQCIDYVSYEIKRIEIISCEGMNFWCTS